MSSTITIGGVSYTSHLRKGFVLEDKATYDLNVSTIVLENLTSDTIFDKYSEVVITTDISTTYWYIASNDLNKTTFTSSPLYNNTIGLINPYKKMERYYRGTINIVLAEDESYTIYDFLTLVRDTTPLRQTTDISTGAVFNFTTSQISTLQGLQCPELTITDPSIKIAIDKALKTVNAKASFTDFDTLYVTFFDSNGNDITLDDVNSFRKYDSIAEFAGTSRANLSNVLTSGNNNAFVVTEPSPDGFKTFRTTDSQLKESNIMAFTDNGIVDVKNFYMRLTIEYIGVLSNGDPAKYTNTVTHDLTDYVVEESVFNSKLVYGTSDSKQTLFYFTKGDRHIYNIGTGYKNVIFSFPTYQYVFEDLFIGTTKIDDDTSQTFTVVSINVTTTFDDILYRISYIPKIDIAMEMIRNNRSIEDGTLTINQTDRIVDVVAFSEMMHSQLQKQGNSIIEVGKVISDDTDAYELGQTYNDYSVIAVKNIFNNHTIISQAKLIENFNMDSEYTGINNQIDRFNTPSDDRTFTRKDVFTQYVDIAYTQSTRSTMFRSYFIPTFMRGLGAIDTSGTYINSVEICRLIGYDPVGTTVLLPMNSIGILNGFIFNVKLNDTVSAGEQTYTNSSEYYERGVDYTDDGTIHELRLTGYSSWDNDTSSDGKLLPELDTTGSALLDNEILDVILEYQKQKGEIPNVTLEAMFTSGYDMGLGLYATTDSPLVYSDTVFLNRRTLYWYASTTETYGKLDYRKALGSKVGTVSSNSYIDSSGYIDIISTIYNSSTYVSWGIADDDGNLYFWSNEISSSNTQVWFNPTPDRD